MRLLVIALVWGTQVFGQQCACDHTTHEYSDRSCGLCAEVDKAPADQLVVFVKDNDPRKPNRWLALPRHPTSGKMQVLSDISAAERVELFRQAIARAKEIWGDRWGVAMNGIRSRGQCHAHVHIGRLIEGVEWGPFQEMNGPEEVPDPGDLGLWIHPVANGKLHVHVEMSTETVLAR